MTQKLNSAEEFLENWWRYLGDISLPKLGEERIPSSRTQDKFTAVPCHCGSEACDGWALTIKEKGEKGIQ